MWDIKKNNKRKKKPPQEWKKKVSDMGNVETKAEKKKLWASGSGGCYRSGRW